MNENKRCKIINKPNIQDLKNGSDINLALVTFVLIELFYSYKIIQIYILRIYFNIFNLKLFMSSTFDTALDKCCIYLAEFYVG